ncbi:hypothetical protein CDAR_57231 [Caerostris darwini]|uniref:Uncharacterized protein n=1 Tax=Caerostris darwini TaxID=1538125 RepID=A0AAV4TQ91_9ARAC|nr:hypothetical protein CDAR_57231 [Caerostris darwini]
MEKDCLPGALFWRHGRAVNALAATGLPESDPHSAACQTRDPWKGVKEPPRKRGLRFIHQYEVLTRGLGDLRRFVGCCVRGLCFGA